MPHIRLETSIENLPAAELKAFFLDLHHFLCKEINATLEYCESRVFVSKNACVGDGTQSQDFLFLEIMIVSGRPLELKQKAGRYAFETLKKYFAQVLEQHHIRPGVTITEMGRELYFK